MRFLTLISFLFLTNLNLSGQDYTADQIKEDVAILKQTISYIHPSLTAYRTTEELATDFQKLEQEMLSEPNLPNAYKAISRFAAKIQCSHTYTNPWNQGKKVQAQLFDQADKVPFTFTRIGKRIFIDKNASEDPRLNAGLEIISINGVDTEQIMAELVQYVTADGGNDEKRFHRLTISGTEKIALFDIYYPLHYGSTDSFNVGLKDHQQGIDIGTRVSATTVAARASILSERYENFEQSFSDLWQFQLLEEQVALLTIKSFAVFDKDFDWKEFLDQSFEQLKQQGVQHLIIDIRENEGGDSDVGIDILRRISTQKIKLVNDQRITNYRKIPEELRPYISTWAKRPYNWSFAVRQLSDAKYQLRSFLAGSKKTCRPKRDGFNGQCYLLIGPNNSSATHTMATYAKKFQLATLVGQATGGNQRGMNGGFIFFHRLPNCGVEIDIPVLGHPPHADTIPNGGIQPDVLVEKQVSDLINGIDSELEATLKLISNGIYSSVYKSSLHVRP